jgi:hypothetical protein
MFRIETLPYYTMSLHPQSRSMGDSPENDREAQQNHRAVRHGEQQFV